MGLNTSPLVQNFQPATQERIVCAAVIHGGIIFQGKRHCDAIRFAVEQIGNPPVRGREGHGFWTSWNRYVNRHQAMQIAITARQIKTPENPNRVLVSEDLY